MNALSASIPSAVAASEIGARKIAQMELSWNSEA
jgi:hypothetical protein